MYSKEYAEVLFLDYMNNFITLSGFAEYYGISQATAQRVINLGKEAV